MRFGLLLAREYPLRPEQHQSAISVPTIRATLLLSSSDEIIRLNALAWKVGTSFFGFTADFGDAGVRQ
ncbi:hypothetical protein Plhal703r1_c15g0072661 [Plasmopara halstedii]